MARKNIEINQASGKRIKELLKENKITQIDFADTIHCTSEHLSAIINGRRRLTEDTARSIVLQFPNIRYEWLMGYDDFKTHHDIRNFAIEKIDEEKMHQQQHSIAFVEYITTLKELGIYPLENGNIEFTDYLLKLSIELSPDDLNNLQKELDKFLLFNIYNLMRERVGGDYLINKVKFESGK